MTLEDLIRDILGAYPPELSDDSGQAELQNWDSLSHMNIVMAIEETYNVSFSTEEITALKSLADARRLLSLKGVAV